MKYYLIAGEASGDLHASNLMAALKDLDPGAEFRFMGGDLMQAVGGTLVRHYREMAYMGFLPVLLHARTILRNMKMCREDIRQYQPDAVVLVDYPGFNLKIAKYVKEVVGKPVYYYISPKIWAWKQYRIKDIRRYVDRMCCILPFEVDYYKGMDYAVDYVGNPSVDSVSNYLSGNPVTADTFRRSEQLTEKPILALLAGSRKQEITDNLPTMMEVASHYPELQPVIAGAPGIDPSWYGRYTAKHSAGIVFNKTYSLLQHSQLALVTSGTATLETSLFRVPQVVCYYTPMGKVINYIFRHFFHIRFISLVNLIMNREVVRELFGEHFSPDNIRHEVDRILYEPGYREKMLEDYDELIRILGEPGASKHAAELIYKSSGMK